MIHSNTSPWAGPTVILDAPVPGAFDFIQDLLRAEFRVAVFSCRNTQEGAKQAMQNWFLDHDLPHWVVENLEFPDRKPAAEIYIDDRGHLFTGTFPSVDYVSNFKTWNRP